MKTYTNRPWIGILFGVSAAAIWSGFPVVTKLGMIQTLSALDVTVIRFVVAGMCLMPLVLRRGLRGAGWGGSWIMAAGAGAPYLLLAAGGLHFAPAAHFGVITPSSNLIFSALLGRRLLGDRLEKYRIVGMAVIVGGLCLLGWDGLHNHLEYTWIGDAMFVVAGFFWASFTVATRHWPADPLHTTAIVAVMSMLLIVPIYVATSGLSVLNASWQEIILQAVFQGVLSAIVALWLYTRAVAILGAARGAVFGALVPGFAVMLAIPVLHEQPTMLQWSGVLLVTAGMLFALGWFRRTLT